MRPRNALIPLLLLSLPVLGGVSQPAAGEWERLTAESLRLYEAGWYGEAIRLSREALEEAAAAFGPRHHVVGKSMNNLGAMLAGHGDREEAEQVLAEALAILEESLGKNHPGTSSSLNNLAELCAARGESGRAEKLFLRALAIRRQAPGEENADLVTTMRNLAALYAGTERFRDAEVLYGELLGLTGGEGAAADLCNMLAEEGNIRREQERPGEAIEAYAKAIDTADRHGVPMPGGPVIVRETLAVLSVKTGDLEGAMSWYGEALDLLPEGEQGERARARLRRDQARVYMKLKRYEEAVPLYEEIVGIQEGSLAPGDADLETSAKELAAALSSLAGTYLESGRSEDAVPLLVRSIKMREKYGERDDPLLAIRMNNLAGILAGLERFGEAEKYFSRAIEILGKSRGEQDADYLLVLSNLKEMYLLSGEIEKAQDVLLCFFELLHGGLYVEAAKLYGGSYQFLLEGCIPDADPADHDRIWSEGCGRCGLQCLEIREVVDWSALTEDGYRFNVKFSTDDGGLFIRGPCCGATGEEPPDSIFHFDVRMSVEGWKVVTLPLYVP